MLRLDSEVQYVKGVGPRRSALLGSRGIRTVEDLLLHIPKSYQDRSVFISLNALTVGQDAAVHGKVYGSRTIHTRSRGKILDIVVTDGSSYAHVKWFHGGHMKNAMFAAGRQIVLFGRAEWDSREGKLVFFNPEFELIEDDETGLQSLDIGRIVPIYEEIAGLTNRQL